jgi:hypothetical protein
MQPCAKPMQFPDASKVPANMLYPFDGSAFDMLGRFIEHEYVDPADMDMRGMLATIGIIKGKPFAPDAHKAPANQFVHVRAFPDYTFTDVVSPNADGSLTLFVQNDSPGRDNESNWLPAPAGSFNVFMRLYWPKQDIVDGMWKMPAVERVK